MRKLTHAQERQELPDGSSVLYAPHHTFQGACFTLERRIPTEGYPRSLVRYLLYFPGARHQRLEILTPNLATMDGRKHGNPDQQSLYQCSERRRIGSNLSLELDEGGCQEFEANPVPVELLGHAHCVLPGSGQPPVLHYLAVEDLLPFPDEWVPRLHPLQLVACPPSSNSLLSHLRERIDKVRHVFCCSTYHSKPEAHPFAGRVLHLGLLWRLENVGARHLLVLGELACSFSGRGFEDVAVGAVVAQRTAATVVRERTTTLLECAAESSPDHGPFVRRYDCLLQEPYRNLVAVQLEVTFH